MCPLCEDGDEGVENINDSEILPDSDGLKAVMEEDVIDMDDNVVVQPPKPLPEPKVPTKAQVAAHNLTHWPYRSWCPHCVAARRPNSHHRSSSDSQRSAPLLVADYCFVRDNDDEETATVLVACLYPSRTMLATVVPAKGADPVAVARLSTFIRHSGYSKIVYKSDQEFSLRALFEEAFRASTRQGELFNDKLTQMVPEASAVGESQSNGKAENAVHKIEDMVRTYKAALEGHIGARVPANHP